MLKMDIAKNLRIIGEKIQIATQKQSSPSKLQPRLVAVSKTKPKELILIAYENGQRHFGENYVQELVEKGNDDEIIQKCPDICWHFIGHLQRNKVSKVVSVPGLYVIETVDSTKLATTINDAWKKLDISKKLKVMVQVNTSFEEEKSGCDPNSAINLVKHILNTCQHLEFIGLMTIGMFGYDYSKGPNPDFLKLRDVRDQICNALDFKFENMELSMGMSDDFEHAIEFGSTNVRVGSSIFGQR